MQALRHILFRADADERIGHGHVMRCFAMAQALRDVGVDVTLGVSACSGGLEARLTGERCRLVRCAPDATETIRLSHEVAADWVVLDGYHFDLECQRAIRQAGHRLMVIDDHGHLREYSADILLNQNLSAHDSLYPRCDAELLLGSDYAMLRREFRLGRPMRRTVPDTARRVLVTTGGSDPHNTGPMVIDALRQSRVSGLEIVIAAGGSNPHVDVLANAVADSCLKIELKRDVSDMPGLMACADLAITGGGSTCWELAYMGVPMITIVLADNQQPIAEALDYRGAAVNVGRCETLTADELAGTIDELAHDERARREMIDTGQGLIDGCGTARVIERMASFVRHAQRSA